MLYFSAKCEVAGMINIKKFLGLELYVSGPDQFMAKYDEAHPGLSHSQHKEKEKYDRVFWLRDHAEPPVAKDDIWKNF
jgi:hypothetical protein